MSSLNSLPRQKQALVQTIYFQAHHSSLLSCELLDPVHDTLDPPDQVGTEPLHKLLPRDKVLPPAGQLLQAGATLPAVQLALLDRGLYLEVDVAEPGGEVGVGQEEGGGGHQGDLGLLQEQVAHALAGGHAPGAK